MIDIKEVSSFIERVESITNKSKSLIIRHGSQSGEVKFNGRKYNLISVFICSHLFGQHQFVNHYFYLTNTGEIFTDQYATFIKIASLKDGVDECIRVIINLLKVWYPEVNKNAG